MELSDGEEGEVRESWGERREVWKDKRESWEDKREPWEDKREPWEDKREPWEDKREPWEGGKRWSGSWTEERIVRKVRFLSLARGSPPLPLPPLIHLSP